ncbi:MAG: hypothetical protein CFE27_14940 [Alphaproteobacteria bacterium PA1]|nr:MAG: hypothetical protein CFE27_14940 [Alphaproteobacteria bacterium PA1]
MALDTLTAKANVGAGTDTLAGHNTAAGFAAASVLITPDGQDLSNHNFLPTASQQRLETAGFSAVGSSVLDVFFDQSPRVGTGVTYNQAAGSLNILTGTTANAEFLARSVNAYDGSMRLRASIITSQRIANQNFAILLADLLGEGLAYNIVNSTTVDVTLNAHGFNATMVGQFVLLGGITGAAGVPGRYAIASIPDANTIRFTVAGWPASGIGTLTLFGRNYVRNLFNGTGQTTMLFNSQRNGWSDTDTTANINSSNSPGTIIQNEITGRDVFLMDSLRISSTTPQFTARASRYENIPEPTTQFYVFLWSYNGTTAPASTTTWTLGHVSVEQFPNQSIYVQGFRAQGAVNALSVGVTGGFLGLNGSTNRIGFTASHGIWWDDSSTVLAAAATFTGTSRDLLVTATATAFANQSTFASELRLSAESDQTGTLWLEVSRDNINWRRVKSVATVAVSGGGFYAEIVHQPSWRYARVGFTNGATLQTRFTLGSIAMAA